MANAIYTIYLAIRSADAEKCAQNLATFGGQTTIKSILLTSKQHYRGRSKGDPPLHTKIKVNRIDLIVVRTPKLAKFCGQISAAALRIAK